jgi:hypothetical protein
MTGFEKEVFDVLLQKTVTLFSTEKKPFFKKLN